MQPVPFKGQTATPGAPEGHEHHCGEMPVYKDPSGYTACWEMSEAEYIELGKTRKVWATIHSGDVVLMTWLGIEAPVFPANRSMHYIFQYLPDSELYGPPVLVWVGCDAPPPKSFILDGIDYTLNMDVTQIKHSPFVQVKVGNLWVRELPEEFHAKFGRTYTLCQRKQGDTIDCQYIDQFIIDVNF